jgi:hypothetical protein
MLSVIGRPGAVQIQGHVFMFVIKRVKYIELILQTIDTNVDPMHYLKSSVAQTVGSCAKGVVKYLVAFFFFTSHAKAVV